jgi:hypothetical protein
MDQLNYWVWLIAGTGFVILAVLALSIAPDISTDLQTH